MLANTTGQVNSTRLTIGSAEVIAGGALAKAYSYLVDEPDDDDDDEDEDDDDD